MIIGKEEHIIKQLQVEMFKIIYFRKLGRTRVNKKSREIFSNTSQALEIKEIPTLESLITEVFIVIKKRN